jgi:hypothetical protein
VNSNEYLWLDALFELSWQREPGDLLHSKRFAQVGNLSIGMVGGGLFPRLPYDLASNPGGSIPHEHGYPMAHHAKLSDIARASVIAIDEILVSERLGQADVLADKHKHTPQPMPTNTESRVFISHSSQDKPFVRRLVQELERHHLRVWFDEQEIGVGDSIVTRISDGLKDSDYFMVVLSKASVASPWVQEEINSALMDQVSGKGTAVLPVLIEECEIPPLLRSRLYADFRQSFEVGIGSLLRVLEQEGESAKDVARRTGPVLGRKSMAPPCSATLSQLPLADLRRRITKRMDRVEVGAIWYDAFGKKMDDDMANRPLVDCVIELLDRAKNRNKLPDIIDGVCADRPDLANP